ncbi:hypothetical protein GSI_09977 [Ganoderma sinense ZZ0214-1]|uniref:Uncharacterized protein n=1 Tax=Ganoderma sinense ZZ0214-1 TaxID=1077348 RepID=A0A2G8S2G0_9APHY|nr:hypothetical protein GSI_09977 [Ganoderma sinense ZZ0214-1]
MRTSRSLIAARIEINVCLVFPGLQERLVQTISLFTNVICVHLVFYCDKEAPCENELESLMRDIRARAPESAGAKFAPPPHLLAACPQLRYFFVTPTGRDDTPGDTPSQRRWNHACAWRVAEPGEDGQSRAGGRRDESAGTTPIVKELCDSAAMRIMEANQPVYALTILDLIIHDSDEYDTIRMAQA